MAFSHLLNTSSINYPQILRQALRGVLREVMASLAEIGPTGEAHLLLTFRTDHEATQLPADLRRRFPDRMMIELQHQFWELEIDDDGFSVVLAFGGKRADLYVPWEAVLSFVDPDANFGLSFEPPEEEPSEETSPPDSECDAEVIPIDRFRRPRAE